MNHKYNLNAIRENMPRVGKKKFVYKLFIKKFPELVNGVQNGLFKLANFICVFILSGSNLNRFNFIYIYTHTYARSCMIWPSDFKRSKKDSILT